MNNRIALAALAATLACGSSSPVNETSDAATNDAVVVPPDAGTIQDDVTVPTPSVRVGVMGSGLALNCALNKRGAAFCWGSNVYGELGADLPLPQYSWDPGSDVPAPVVGLGDGTRAIAVGTQHACAITGGGGVKCWGRGFGGALGTGNEANSAVPVDVVGLSSGVAALSIGETTTCALTDAGAVKCWGFFNGSSATPNGSLVPVDADGLSSNVKAIAVADAHGCALTTAGAVKCWGVNSTGAIGNGSHASNEIDVTAVDVVGLSSGVIDISAGQARSCALLASGTVKCWGVNSVGQLGTIPLAGGIFDEPIDVPSVTGARALAPGATCAYLQNGGVSCWGEHGIPPYITPAAYGGYDLGLGTVVALSNGIYMPNTGCAILSDDTARCWGPNDSGQLGNGTTAPSYDANTAWWIPVAVTSF